MSSTGDRLRELRKERNMSQATVAEAIGITRPGYVRYETGAGGLSVESLEKLSELFSVSTDYILCKTDNPNLVESGSDDISIDDIDYAFYEGMPEKLSHEEKSQIIAFARFMREERRKEELEK